MTDPESIKQIARHLVSTRGELNYWDLVDLIERELVVYAMDLAGNNCSEAAKILGMPRPSLVEKRRRLGLPIALKNQKSLGSW